jgi:hypothetical protein
LISGVVEITLAGSQTPTPQNIAIATTLLRRAMRALDMASSDVFKQADAVHAMYATNRLGRIALRHDHEASALSMVQAVGITGQRHPKTVNAASQVLFELGVEAVERKKPLIGISALDHLTSLVEKNAPAAGELVAHTLGLLGHFWIDGETSREFSRERLLALAGFFRDEILPALGSTIEHCANHTLFGTADCVREMRRELEGEREA